MRFDYESLSKEVECLDEWWKRNKNILKGVNNDFSEIYKSKYLDLLFEFYSSLVEFSSYYLDNYTIKNKKYTKGFEKHLGCFITAYARLVQFSDFADVELPGDIVDNFCNWVNKRIDLVEYLAYLEKNKLL